MKKRVLSVLVAALLLLTMLTACGSKTDKAMLGKWVCEMDFGSYLNEGLATEPEIAQYLMVDEFVLEVELYLNEDGTYKMVADEEAAKEMFKGVQEDFKEGMGKYLDAMIKEQGLNMTVDEMLQMSGTTFDALVEEAFGDAMLNEMISEFETEGKYKVEDGKLYMSEDLDSEIDEEVYETYEFSGDEFKLLESFGDEDAEEFKDLYPIVFKKLK